MFSLNIFWLYNGAKATYIQQESYVNFESDLLLVCEIYHPTHAMN